MSWDESEILASRGAIFEAAKAMLAGTLSYIEGARKIIAARAAARFDEWDADLVPFLGIVSETDTLPFGEARSHWRAAALDALQAEIAKKEAWARQFGESHCRNLVERFSNGQIETRTLFS
jgi:hypothetical protein